MSAGNGRWSIDVAVAQQILRTVDGTIEKFDSDARTLAEAIQAASGTVGASKTGSALDTVVNEALMADVATAKVHAMNASAQTSTAVNSYVLGDLEMAQNAAKKVDL